MNSQLATWQHVTTQFKCDVTNITCLNTIDANMCGAFETKHTQPFQHPTDISHTRSKQTRSKKTPNDKQTHHSQQRQLQHIMTNGTLPHNNTVQKLRKPCGKQCRLMNMMTNISRNNYNGGCACAGWKPTNMSKANYRFPDYCLHTTPPKLLPPQTTVSPIVVCNRTC